MEFATIQEIVTAAKRNLSQHLWDYISGGSESETTMRRNRLSLDCLAFKPRVLRDVSVIDTSTTVLRHELRIPVMMAPVGSLQMFTPEGAIAVARAAEAFGTLCYISSSTQPSLEETAAASKTAKFFQLYLKGDMKWMEDSLHQIGKAGYQALCLTVDAPYYGRRERQMMSRWIPPSKPGTEGWIYQANMSWETIREIRKIWDRPLILKGIARPADAKRAVDCGVEGIYVSNHGGRQLDHGQAAIDILPNIVSAVGNHAEVFVDGGFVRGSDVVKAICLGAKAVGIGKLLGWALAAAGQQGLARALELLEAEIRTTMGLLGVASLDQLGPDYLCSAQPAAHPHELSAFVHMGGFE